MKRIFTFLVFAVAMMSWPVLAQEIDESFVFMDEDGNIIENEATVIRNDVDHDGDGNEVIYSGISVMNMGGSLTDDYLKVHYAIERLDAGTYQICFPTTCNMQSQVGDYETGMGLLMADVQDIQSEWFPGEADGECIVHLTIEIFSKQPGFPPTYSHKAWGPTITLRFVKGEIPEPGNSVDVNGDGEVNLADVNAVIDMILAQITDKKGDVNGDGEVNIADVNTIIDSILNKA